MVYQPHEGSGGIRRDLEVVLNNPHLAGLAKYIQVGIQLINTGNIDTALAHFKPPFSESAENAIFPIADQNMPDGYFRVPEFQNPPPATTDLSFIISPARELRFQFNGDSIAIDFLYHNTGIDRNGMRPSIRLATIAYPADSADTASDEQPERVKLNQAIAYLVTWTGLLFHFNDRITETYSPLSKKMKQIIYFLMNNQIKFTGEFLALPLPFDIGGESKNERRSSIKRETVGDFLASLG